MAKSIRTAKLIDLGQRIHKSVEYVDWTWIYINTLRY